MSERTAEATTTVDEDGIRVEKSFTDDAFPVPAVMYELSSTRAGPRARAHRRPNPRVVPDGPDRVPPGVRERELDRLQGPPRRVRARRRPRRRDRDRVRHPRRRPRPRGLPRNAGHRARPGRRGDRRRPWRRRHRRRQGGALGRPRDAPRNGAAAHGRGRELGARGGRRRTDCRTGSDRRPPEAAEADEESEDTESPEPREVVAGTAAVTSHTEAGRGRTGCGRASRRRAERCDDRGRRRRRVG